MRRFAPLWLAAALGVACEEPTADLELDLRQGDCTADDLAQISVVSIEVWGGGAGDMCTLGKRCVFDVDLPDAPSDVEVIEEKIAAVNQPLIDVEFEGARWVALIGRTQAEGCFAAENPPACAQAEVADADNGTLVLTLRCGEEACDAIMEYPLCP
jgi:hypothetical protein